MLFLLERKEQMKLELRGDKKLCFGEGLWKRRKKKR
jgi:hypothetical protein